MTLSMVVEHLSMVVFAIVIAILIGVPRLPEFLFYKRREKSDG